MDYKKRGFCILAIVTFICSFSNAVAQDEILIGDTINYVFFDYDHRDYRFCNRAEHDWIINDSIVVLIEEKLIGYFRDKEDSIRLVRNITDGPSFNNDRTSYFRQAVTFQDSTGEQYLYINFLWNDYVQEDLITYKSRWIMPLGGGSYAWELLFNYSSMKVEEVLIYQ